MPWKNGQYLPPRPEECDFERCRDGSQPCALHPINGWTMELMEDGSPLTPLERMRLMGAAR
jgi:hypothetical protein